MSSSALRRAIQAMALATSLLVGYHQLRGTRARPKHSAEERKATPEFRAPPRDANGATLRHRLEENQVMLLNFWETWCRSCQSRFPDSSVSRNRTRTVRLLCSGSLSMNSRQLAVTVKPYLREGHVELPCRA